MLPFIERLIKEKEDLEEKLNKLNCFLDKEENREKSYFLKEQKDIMEQYIYILNKRIEHHIKQEEEENGRIYN